MEDETNDELIKTIAKRVMWIDRIDDLLNCQLAIALMVKGKLLTMREYELISNAVDRQRHYITNVINLEN